MPKESFKERMWKQRQEEILSEAENLICANGYHALNMDVLAEAVGVAKPTLYQHFKSKEDLMTEVLLRAMEKLEQHLLTPHPGTTAERLAEIVHLLLEARHSPASPLAAFDQELMLTLIHTHPDIRERKHRTNILLQKLIDDGKARGEITSDMPTQMIIGWIFCSSNVLRAAYPDSSSDYWNEHLNQYIDQFTRRFVHAITP